MPEPLKYWFAIPSTEDYEAWTGQHPGATDVENTRTSVARWIKKWRKSPVVTRTVSPGRSWVWWYQSKPDHKTYVWVEGELLDV